MYIRRWLTAPIVMPDGNTILRDKGTPQGGVISPVLSNLFLHYVFDKWMLHHHPETLWCRYADDGLVHCKTEKQALTMLNQLAQRFNQCGLELHPDKTKVVYCKDSNRKGKYSVRGASRKPQKFPGSFWPLRFFLTFAKEPYLLSHQD